MMATTRLEPDFPSPTKHHTAPITPSRHQQKPSMGFFKRHLSHRRKSSTTITNGVPASTSSSNSSPPSTPPHTPIHFKSPFPGSDVSHSNPPSRRGSHWTLERRTSTLSTNHEIASIVSNGTASTNATLTTVGSVEEAEEPALSPGKKAGVKWAIHHDDLAPPRPRRTSSATTNRRTSIYLRGAEGSYVEGVDAGVGSKARRLSVHIPDDDELDVDECKLHEHFNILARSTKKEIGEGGAAVVKLMQSKTAGGAGGGTVFAVKEFREWDSKEEDRYDYIRKIKSEYAISKSCEHPNIVKTFRLCTVDRENRWYHVMEYCELGDLNDLIKKGYFSREDRNCMFKQLLRGVDYLHSRGLAHRDLKSENLLVTKTGCLKIADFGTAEVFCGTHPGLQKCRRPSLISDHSPTRLCSPGLIGSKPYMAPEILSHQDYDPRGVDVWSCAIVYITLCLGGTPWECASVDIKNYNIYCNTWETWLAKYPDGELRVDRELPAFVSTPQFRRLDDAPTKRLVLGMLHPDASQRWSIHDALNAAPVADYPCCQQEGYSEDIKTRQRKAMHNHVPPKTSRGPRFLKGTIGGSS